MIIKEDFNEKKDSRQIVTIFIANLIIVFISVQIGKINLEDSIEVIILLLLGIVAAASNKIIGWKNG